MEPKNKNKRQHYVPQFYLREFSCDIKKKKIWVHNKNNNKSKRDQIREVGQENFFYELPEEFINSYNHTTTKNVDKYIVETQMMGKIDKDGVDFLRPFLRDIHSRGFDKVVSAEEKEKLYNLMAYQYLRTKKARSAISLLQNTQKLKDSYINTLYLHTILKDNQKIVRQAVQYFFNMDLVIFINKTSKPLITSDHPVVQSKVFYYYPLTPFVLIALFDKGYRGKYNSSSIANRVSTISEEYIVSYCNSFQYNQCVENVFSNNIFTDSLIK